MRYLGQAGQQNCLQSGSSKLIDIHCLNKFKLRVMENAPDICEPWACKHLFTCTHTYICIQGHNKNTFSKDMFQACICLTAGSTYGALPGSGSLEAQHSLQCWSLVCESGMIAVVPVSSGSQFPVYLGPAGILPGVGNGGSQGRTPLWSSTCHVGREWQGLAVGAGPSLVPSLCQEYGSIKQKKEGLLQEIQALLFIMKALLPSVAILDERDGPCLFNLF